MKPPRCRLCEHEHWNNEPHVLAVVNKAKAPVVNTPRKQKVVRAPARSEVVGRVEQSSEVGIKVGRQTAWQKANRGKYNEKMRDYMRKRRAASK